MAHFKTEVLQTRNDSLRFLTKQRDIFAGAIASLNETIAKIDNCKKMLLMVAVDTDNMEANGPLDLTEESPIPLVHERITP